MKKHIHNIFGGEYLFGNQLSRFSWYRGLSDNSKYALELTGFCMIYLPVFTATAYFLFKAISLIG